MMNIQCEDARPLIPSYVDGELSDAQATLLREHLLECMECRKQTQGHKAFRRWFAHPAQATVPVGFASRVARRAFAGDTGDAPDEVAARSSAHGVIHDMQQYVLRFTSVAAALLLVFAVGIRTSTLPVGHGLAADEGAVPSLEDVLEDLEEIEAAEQARGESMGRGFRR